MNGNKDIPLEKWRKEYAELRERYDLETVRINKLSDELKAAERIMRGELIGNRRIEVGDE